MAAREGFHEGKVCKIARNDGPRINGEITSRTCRLIGVDGSQLGLFGVRDALRIANQARVEVKEMKFRPKIDVGDYETKKAHVVRFLKKGARVKITIMFRGREMAHPEQGRIVLDRLAEDLKDVATVESKPQMEGRNMHMLIVPIKGAFDEKASDDDKSQKEN